jgi:type IV pilus assembly protein PilE
MQVGNNMKSRIRGITLIELMVTMAVLAVIAGIAVPLYSGYIQSAYRTECGNEVAAIELALNENFLENNTYFQGNDIIAIRDNSNGFYAHSFLDDATALASNCTYDIDPGTTGDIASSYQVNAIGQNDLAGEGCIIGKPDETCP